MAGIINLMVGAGLFATVNSLVPGADRPSVRLTLTLYDPIFAVRGIAIVPVIVVAVTLFRVVRLSTVPAAFLNVTEVCPGMKFVP